jgi:flagellar protein FliO/FliZ
MIRRIRTLFLGICLFLSAQITLAAEQTTAKTLTTPPVTTGALFETLLGLIFVLSLIAFLAWLLRRTGRFQMTSNGEMKIIASLALGPRERAVLLQVGEQQILVGVTTQQIQTLHVLEHNISHDNAQSMPSGFANKLQKMMQQQGSES